MLRDDGLAEMHVDKAGGGELGGARGKGGVEGALVVIVAVCGGGVFATDVDDRVAGGEEGRITGAEEGGRVIGGEKAEKVDS